jgi:hypothetical protein
MPARNPFLSLPFNIKKAYVMGTSDGCEIYIPCASDNAAFMAIKKNELQKWLNNQLQPAPPVEPIRA